MPVSSIKSNRRTVSQWSNVCRPRNGLWSLHCTSFCALTAKNVRGNNLPVSGESQKLNVSVFFFPFSFLES